MAGIIKVDRVQSDSNLAFNIAGANVAFMDASALRLVGSGITTNGTTIVSGGKVVTAAQPTGSVLQVIQANTTTAQVFNSGSVNQTTWYDISGLSVTITPTSATSKIFVQAAVCMAGSSDAYNVNLKLVRNSTDVGTSNSYGNGFVGTASFRSMSIYQITTVPVMHLDSPNTTSAVTYKLQINNAGGSTYPTYVNRTEDIANNAWRSGCISSITVMEIAG